MPRHMITLAFTAALTACGGGNNEEDDSMNTGINNPPGEQCPESETKTNRDSILASLLLTTTLVAGCSDGGTDSDITVSGTLFTAGQTVIDYDINDVNSGTRSNDDPFNAQPIPNVITVQGFASDSPTNALATDDAEFERFANTVDQQDYFAVSLQANQRIVMNVVDYQTNSNEDSVYSGDLDLYLYSSPDKSVVINTSQGTGSTEELSIPADGDYILEVRAYSGISKYVLQILPANNVILDAHKGTPYNESPFITGEAIVKWKTPAAANAANSGLNIKGMQAIPLSVASERPVKMRLQPTPAMQAASVSRKDYSESQQTLITIKALNQRSDVAYAEPNYIRRAMLQPDDDLYRLQFHYGDIRLPQAWDLTKGSSSVTVAVIDGGVFLNHTDLNGKLVSGYDFISDPSISRDGDGIDSNPDDPGDSNQRGASSWHGTHVSGTVAASTDNDAGVAGAGWNTRVMPLRVLGLNGEGSTYDVAQAIRYAAGLSNDSGTLPASRADIINLSLGSGFRSSAEQEVITEARNAGVIIIAAAGNSATDEPFYPASYDGVVSVSATAPNNTLAYYSNYGSRIDVAAPGGDLRFDSNADGQNDGVLSTSVDDSTGVRTSSYTLQQGTSMASPHVAGVAALMKAVYPSLSPSDFDSLLSAGRITDDIGASGRDDNFGHGLINALKAVQEANNLAGGGSLPQVPVLESTPPELQFGGDSSLILTLDNVNNNASDPVISFSTSDTWLKVAADQVDTNGFGSYQITIDRTDLIDGIYEGFIRFTPDFGNSLDVAVTMRVGDIVAITNSAPQYVLLEDADTSEIVAETFANPDGTYEVTKVPAGRYRVFAGSDIDVDLYICQNGETCGGYPDSVSEEVLDITDSISGIDFVVSLVSGISANTSSTPGILRAAPVDEKKKTQPDSTQPEDITRSVAH